jgi:hypothetical protein
VKKLVVLSVLLAVLSSLLLGCKSDPEKIYTVLIKEYTWVTQTQRQYWESDAMAITRTPSIFAIVYANIKRLEEITGPATYAASWTETELTEVSKTVPRILRNAFYKQLSFSGNAIGIAADGWIYVEEYK